MRVLSFKLSSTLYFQLEKHLAADKPKAEETTKKGAETKRSQKSPLESSVSEAPPLRVSVSADEKRRHVQQPVGQGESGKSGKELDKEKREHEYRGRKRPASPSTVFTFFERYHNRM